MKIVKIETTDNEIFSVHLEPYFIERIFGVKPKVVKYKDSGKEYFIGKQTVYIKENGEKCGNENRIAEKIDCWRRSF